jgi:hypothetical protein
MKYLYLTLALMIVAIVCRAQNQIPDTLKLKLSKNELLSITSKIDSLEAILGSTSTLPANQVNSFNQRANNAFSVMWKQIQEQIIEENKKTKTKK